MDATQCSRVAAVAARGGVVAYPTEACFGLGCDPLSETAVRRILALKRRPVHQGLILVAARLEQLAPFLAAAAGLLEAPRGTWPGPYTWILPASAATPGWIVGRHHGVAVRVSDHPGVIGLCESFGGALVSTSANPHGLPPATTAAQVNGYFRGRLDAILEGDLGGRPRPSEIRDALTGAVLRS